MSALGFKVGVDFSLARFLPACYSSDSPLGATPADCISSAIRALKYATVRSVVKVHVIQISSEVFF